MPVACNHRNEVVVAVANVVVVVVTVVDCGIRGRSESDARTLRRTKMRRGVPGWLEGGRPLTSPQAFFLSVCSVVMVVGRGILATKYDLFVGTKPEIHKTYPYLLKTKPPKK